MDVMLTNIIAFLTAYYCFLNSVNYIGSVLYNYANKEKKTNEESHDYFAAFSQPSGACGYYEKTLWSYNEAFNGGRLGKSSYMLMHALAS